MEQIIQYINTTSINEWVMASVAIVLIMSLSLIKRQRKLQQQQVISMQSLQRDLRALANAAVGVGGRVLEIERHQRKSSITVTESNVTSHPKINSQNAVSQPVEFYNNSNQPYEQAIRMAQSGASTKDIVNICGLSKSEADLVSMMHRLDKAS